MENAATQKLFDRGEKSMRRGTRPQLALAGKITKWQPTEQMRQEWRRKPYQ